MKKIFLPIIGLLLFSCSQEEQITVNDHEKIPQTIENGIRYVSPYKYNGYLEHRQITYTFTNTTNITFKVTPYFGIAYYINNGRFFGGASLPNLGVNGHEHGNYMKSKDIVIPAFQTVSVGSNSYAVPLPQLNDGMGYFDFSHYTNLGNHNEEYILAKNGKLVYVEGWIDDAPKPAVVKLPIRYNFNTSNVGTLPYPWQSLNITDSYFSDELIYNQETLEVCSTIQVGGVMDYKKMTHNGRNYYLQIVMNDWGIDVVLKEM